MGIFSYKVVLIGERGVGKTSLIQRYTEDKYFEN
jgi:GTPase SAR1 family protein